MIYKTFKKVSNVCQLLDKSKYYPSGTYQGVLYTVNDDGSVTLNGTATDITNYSLQSNISVIKGHKYLAGFSGTALEPYLQLYAQDNTRVFDIAFPSDAGSVVTCLKDNNELYYQIKVRDGETVNNVTVYPQFIDLTEMYGAGNEPTTVEQFRQDFPDEMYDYKPYCFVKSYKTLLKASDYCQVLDKSKYNPSKTIYGVTFTKNDDGTFTANGTATATIDYRVVSKNAKINVVVGHKYLMRGCPAGGSKDTYDMRLPFLGIDYGNGLIAKLVDSGADYYIQIIVKAGTVCDNLVFKPQLFDLTEMYGAGNEPTTVEEFREKFPNELYDYKPYSIITSYKKSLVCKTKNLLPYPYYETTITRNGVTFTDNRDGTITANGTSTGFATFVFSKNYNFIAGNTYYVSTPYSIIAYKENGTIHYIQGNKSFTWSSNWEVVQIYVQINKGITLNNLKIYPMISLGDTATDYVPYGHL